MLTEAGRINTKRTNAIKAHAVAGEKLFNRGWSTKIKEISPGKFSVPSEFTTGLAYEVVPGECYCNCDCAKKGDLCKHLHLMNQIGNSQCTLVPQLEISIQSWALYLISHSKHQVHDKELMEISVESQLFQTTNYCTLLRNVCTCKAFSYYQRCACLCLAQLLVNPDQNFAADPILESASNDLDGSQPGEQIEPVPNEHSSVEKPDHKQETIDKLNTILGLIAEMDVIKPDIIKQVDDLHSKVSGKSNFPKKGSCRKRKLDPLHPERQQIRINKRKIARADLDKRKVLAPKNQTDHDHSSYVSSQPKKVIHKDFKQKSFKMKYAPSKRPSIKKQLAKSELVCDKPFLSIKVTSQALEFITREKQKTPLPKENLQAAFFDTILTQVKVLCGGILPSDDETVLSQLIKYWKTP